MAKFLGGKADGHTYDVPDDVRGYRIPIAPDLEVTLNPSIESAFEPPNYTAEDYRREWLRGPSDEHSLFVERSVSPDEMLERLIAGYHPVDPRVMHADLIRAIHTLRAQVRHLKHMVDAANESAVESTMRRYQI